VRYFQQRVNVPGWATDLDRVRTIDFGNCFNGFIEIPGAHACLAFSFITDLASQLGNLGSKRGPATVTFFCAKRIALRKAATALFRLHYIEDVGWNRRDMPDI
jgi:hypothetical protein